MRRHSFRFRLVVGAVIWIVLGLGASGTALYVIMRSYLKAEVVEELHHHAAELAGLVVAAPSGALALRQDLSDRRFFEPGSGHYWQVTSPGVPSLRSGSLGSENLPVDPAKGRDLATYDTYGPSGRLMLLVERIAPPLVPVEMNIAVGVDAKVMDDLLREFSLALALSLGAIAIGLVAAVLVQVTFGLWPLNRIRHGLAAIRQGQANRLSDDLPKEVAPLAESLNAMIAANDDVVRRARSQAGNLAHALQTPLAILMDEGRRMQAAGGDGTVVLREAERMRRHIEFQLAHARASASRGRPHAAAPILPALRGLLVAVSRLHRERAVTFELTDAPEHLNAACEAEDLDEMLGNLIENAAKWAASRVRATVTATSRTMVRIAIEDDGPGMPADERERVFLVGQRLDEAVAGHGLGLAIVRDIATLYGGSVEIGDSELGGAIVVLDLPRPR